VRFAISKHIHKLTFSKPPAYVVSGEDRQIGYYARQGTPPQNGVYPHYNSREDALIPKLTFIINKTNMCVLLKSGSDGGRKP
jgi:hypothetical protein